jgi:ornithine cyclodeaminase/alanine dehydrogenase-like protein (mu-crystallin family)
MPFTVLSDNDVRSLLHTLTKEDLESFQLNLAEALHSYSTGDTNSPCCSDYQPLRTVLKKNGVTTLFMPATTGGSVGMKVISLEQPEAPSKKSSVSSATSSLQTLELTPAASSDSSSSISGGSFRPTATVDSPGGKPRGTVTLLDASGYPHGIINAEEMTAFRTALAATSLFRRRDHVHTVTIFGAGKQAYWHIRLALLMRAKEIHHINIINRSFERAIKLMKSFHVGEGGKQEWSHVKFSVLSPEFGEYGRLLKDEVRKADVIFCCTPSLEPLFPHEFLTSHEGRKKGRFITAIGSYAPHMIELHPEILKQAAKPDTGGHFHKHAKSEGVVIVDSLEACLKEAGEVIQAKLKPDQLVEVGELIMVKKAAMKEIEAGGEGEKGLLEWLRRGNVIYKMVGLGLMDMVCGADLITLARKRGVGTTIEDF